MPVRTVLAVVVALSLAAGSAVAQEKVFTTLSTDQMEQLLKGLNVEFKKSQSKKVEGHFYYDFSLPKNRLGTRVYYFQGKDMMIDVVFPESPLEKLNVWNATRARVSRATAHKEGKSPFTTLEANLNFAGGVTENAVRRFILDFQEATAFDRFLNNKMDVAPPTLDPSGDKILKSLTNEKVEEILKKMNLTAKKQNFNGNFFYDYESPKSFKIRLTDFANEDLMLNAVFKKMPLETINKYNFNRKFIRAVLYNQGNVEYTALEANLDCSAGISENMVRHFMITFEEEVQNFIEFINKN
jgi:hypothetical protein